MAFLGLIMFVIMTFAALAIGLGYSGHAANHNTRLSSDELAGGTPEPQQLTPEAGQSQGTRPAA